jgi:hypothetical protein
MVSCNSGRGAHHRDGYVFLSDEGIGIREASAATLGAFANLCASSAKLGRSDVLAKVPESLAQVAAHDADKSVRECAERSLTTWNRNRDAARRAVDYASAQLNLLQNEFDKSARPAADGASAQRHSPPIGRPNASPVGPSPKPQVAAKDVPVRSAPGQGAEAEYEQSKPRGIGAGARSQEESPTVQVLITALHDSDAEVRLQAAEELGRLGSVGRPAVFKLLGMITARDEDKRVSEAALKAVQAIQAASANLQLQWVGGQQLEDRIADPASRP